MKRIMTMFLSLLAIAGISPPAKSAGEPVAKLFMGSYIDHMGGFEGEWSLELDLDKNGRATYTVSNREAGESLSSKTTDILRGRWEVKADRLIVSFHEENVEKSVEYKITECLSYVSNTSVHCSLGLEPVTDTISHSFSLPLWYVVKARR